MVEFYNINPENLIQLKYPEFTFQTYFTGKNATNFNGEKVMTIMDDLKMVWIFVLVVLVLTVVAIVLYAIKSMREIIRTQVKQALEEFFFSGMILSINIAFVKQWVAVNHQIS